jgi:UDP-N-acetylmuramoylalanine--D-glutamate ligase
MLKLKGKRVLVMGLGLFGGGRAVTEWLYSQDAIVTVTDLKTKNELQSSIKGLTNKRITWHLGGHQDEDFTSNDLIVQNPGVPKESKYLTIARNKKIPIYNEASLFFLLATRPIIAVTGTRGKSTTSSLIYKILKREFPKTILAGNRGDVPMFSFTREAVVRTKDPIVLELSSWQVEGLIDIKRSPHIALLTNLYPDHLNRYKSLQEYYEMKTQLFAFQDHGDVAIFNADNTASVHYAKKVTAQIYWFSTNAQLPIGCNGVYKKNTALVYRKGTHEKRIVDLLDITITGTHNEENIAAAALTARLFGASTHAIHETVRSFESIWGRQQHIGVKNGIRFINDTTATTPLALEMFIKTFPGSIIIAGGGNKKLSFSHVAKKLTEKNVKALILIPGSATTTLLQEIARFKKIPKIVSADNLSLAFKKALSIARKGDTIGLCPGATSFSHFVNMFERGREFEKLVKKLDG